MGGLVSPFGTQSQLPAKPNPVSASVTTPAPPWQRIVVLFDKQMNPGIAIPLAAYDITVDGTLRDNGPTTWLTGFAVRISYSGAAPLVSGVWRYLRNIGAFQGIDGSESRPPSTHVFFP